VVESNGEIVDADGVSARRLRQRVQALLEKLQLLEAGKENVGLHEQAARFHDAAAGLVSAATTTTTTTDSSTTAGGKSKSKSKSSEEDADLTVAGRGGVDKELPAAAHRQRRSVSLARQLELISRWPETKLEGSALQAFASLAATTVDALLVVEEEEKQSGGGEDAAVALLRGQVRAAITAIRQQGSLITKEGAAECFMALDEQLARLPPGGNN
jgi:hypothetical protein